MFILLVTDFKDRVSHNLYSVSSTRINWNAKSRQIHEMGSSASSSLQQRSVASLWTLDIYEENESAKMEIVLI